jgi:hypothetical protein
MPQVDVPAFRLLALADPPALITSMAISVAGPSGAYAWSAFRVASMY